MGDELPVGLAAIAAVASAGLIGAEYLRQAADLQRIKAQYGETVAAEVLAMHQESRSLSLQECERRVLGRWFSGDPVPAPRVGEILTAEEMQTVTVRPGQPIDLWFGDDARTLFDGMSDSDRHDFVLAAAQGATAEWADFNEILAALLRMCTAYGETALATEASDGSSMLTAITHYQPAEQAASDAPTLPQEISAAVWRAAQGER